MGGEEGEEGEGVSCSFLYPCSGLVVADVVFASHLDCQYVGFYYDDRSHDFDSQQPSISTTVSEQSRPWSRM